MLPANGAGQNPELRKIFLNQFDQLERLFFVVDGDNENARPLRARGAQEIEPGRIAIK